jgi:rhodanese-related sulfurtransferase
MAQNIILGHEALMERARSKVKSVSAAETFKLLDASDTVIIDIRDVRELEREGRIPGSFHAPRGLLEFWVDPTSPYHKPVFAEDNTFIIQCASGWRSLLATELLQDMGLNPVLNLEGGFAAWKEAGGTVEKYEKKT